MAGAGVVCASRIGVFAGAALAALTLAEVVLASVGLVASDCAACAAKEPAPRAAMAPPMASARPNRVANRLVHGHEFYLRGALTPLSWFAVVFVLH